MSDSMRPSREDILEEAFRLLRRWHVAWQISGTPDKSLDLSEETHLFLTNRGGLLPRGTDAG